MTIQQSLIREPSRLASFLRCWTLAFAIWLVALISQPASADPDEIIIRAAASNTAASNTAIDPASGGACQHTFWEVSTRCLPTCAGSGSVLENCQVTQRHDLGHQIHWSASELGSLTAHCQANPANRLVVYVHGNWMPADAARQRAVAVYDIVRRKSCGQLTFVSYSWPSQKTKGFARDVLGKKTRIDTDSFYLANLLQKLPADQPPGLLGFSFGGRVIVGSMHLLAGGQIGCYRLAETNGACYRVNMFAPAFDRTALGSGGRYHRALDVMAHVVNLYNSRDPILRRFRFFDRQSRPTAAGFAGLLATNRIAKTTDRPLAASHKIAQYDCRHIGRSHSELDYFQCSASNIAIRNLLGQ